MSPFFIDLIDYLRRRNKAAAVKEVGEPRIDRASMPANPSPSSLSYAGGQFSLQEFGLSGQ
jgi:hypothetical protein